MQSLPTALQAMALYKQFVIYKIKASTKRIGKTDKLPVNPATMMVANAHDPSIWVDADSACAIASTLGEGWGVGFVFTDNDPFWFVDIDNCLIDGQWSAVAQELCATLAGAAIEVSQSGTGLHIIGTGTPPDHGCKNTAHGLEFYHTERFVALTGTNAVGDSALDCSASIPGVVERYFPASERHAAEDWRDVAVDEWNGPDDDSLLVSKAIGSRSASGVFGGKATFEDLWNNNEQVLARAHPSQNDHDPYDRSSADAALAQHLSFWTGKNHERVERMMRQSALVREKWDGHPNYMQMTVTSAVSRQGEVYNSGGKKNVVGVTDASTATIVRVETEYTVGDQILTGNQMADYFEGCVYVTDQHRILTPDGALLQSGQFNARYGGYVFMLDAMNEKSTRKAFDAFTECQAVKMPKVDTTCFRPDLAPGCFTQVEGKVAVNTYVPADTTRVAGDATPFIEHIKLLLPRGDDAVILMSWIAAAVQYPGVKFQWWPLLCGVEGNGKTTVAMAVGFALGQRYTHTPKAAHLDNKFNAWVSQCLLAVIEEIYVTDRRDVLEAMKPLVTNTRIEIEGKGGDQYTGDNFVRGIICTNHKDGVPITADTRRYSVFYCAQQTKADRDRDFPGDYFPRLYDWLKSGGYEIVNEYLHTYQIDARFNPAGDCQTAPVTSSTSEAIELSRGGVEQEVMEAIEEGAPGFSGGWVSSQCLNQLLARLRADRKIPPAKRRALMQSLGYDWHPGLSNGRVNNTIAIEGCKPKLYIKQGHIHSNLTTASEISRHYCDAQNYPALGNFDATVRN